MFATEGSSYFLMREHSSYFLIREHSSYFLMRENSFLIREHSSYFLIRENSSYFLIREHSYYFLMRENSSVIHSCSPVQNCRTWGRSSHSCSWYGSSSSQRMCKGLNWQGLKRASRSGCRFLLHLPMCLTNSLAGMLCLGLYGHCIISPLSAFVSGSYISSRFVSSTLNTLYLILQSHNNPIIIL